jgi:hypothetical protein
VVAGGVTLVGVVGVVVVVIETDAVPDGRHRVWPGWMTVAVVAPFAVIRAVIDTFEREAIRLHASPLTTE